MTLFLKAYTPSTTFTGYAGIYSDINASKMAATIKVQRDLFAGDSLTINSKRNSLDAELSRIRPIRFYHDSTKLFDGFIRAPSYKFKSNSRNDFSAVAVSWDKELSEITLRASDNAVYAGATLNAIFTDLMRIANNYGLPKLALYAYDTTKIPSAFYNASLFTSVGSPDFTGKTIMQALQELTQRLDAVDTVHTDYPGEWYIKTDSLQSEDYIYIIPQMATTAVTPAKFFKNHQMVSGKSTEKDFTRLVNFSEVTGSGFSSESIKATKILSEIIIATADEYYDATNQPSVSTVMECRYLKLTVENSTGSAKLGSITINGFSNPDVAPEHVISETWYMKVPTGTTRFRYSIRRYAVLAGGSTHAFRVTGYSGCKLTVEECTLAIAGRSVQAYGVRMKNLSKNNLVSQAEVDSYAVHQTKMYHAPLVKTSFELLPAYIDYADILGRTVNAYDELKAAQTDFFCTRQEYSFAGKSVHESLILQRYNLDWEFVD